MDQNDTADLKLVAIGTSAGGLDALLSLFSQLRYSHTSFVIAQHMARDEHTRLVASLLTKGTSWPVKIPDDRCKLLPGVIYLLPARKDARIETGYIRLLPPAPDSYSSPSANQLFYSLAVENEQRALGIVLSGAGSDGALGADAITRCGGRVWVQYPEEAGYDSMPLATIDRCPQATVAKLSEIAAFLYANEEGCADNADSFLTTETAPYDTKRSFIENISTKSVKTADRESDVSRPHTAYGPETACHELDTILNHVLQTTGVSFQGYKEETLLRRLEKRKHTLSLTEPGAYQAYLIEHHEEAQALQQFLLISVSAFFRDRDVFDHVEHLLLKSLTRKQIVTGADNTLRILVAACATGEEAYSLAIVCRCLAPDVPVQITAIDLNEVALEYARKGCYASIKTESLPDVWRHTGFSIQDKQAYIKPEIRRMVFFEQADLLTTDLPGGLDFVFCRNLLIYLKRTQQDQLIRKFYRSMSVDASLVIGIDESLTPASQCYFSVYDGYHRIFRYRPERSDGSTR